MSSEILVRYGTIPEVARFAHDLDAQPLRGEMLVISSRRGTEIGAALEPTRATVPALSNGTSADSSAEETLNRILRRATPEDLALSEQLRAEAQAEYATWQERIAQWNLQLELIDLEWTLDRQKLMLYVLGGRGPDVTRLALQAAAAGTVAIDVQPVDASGLMALPPSGGGCGSGGGSCGCHS